MADVAEPQLMRGYSRFESIFRVRSGPFAENCPLSEFGRSWVGSGKFFWHGHGQRWRVPGSGGCGCTVRFPVCGFRGSIGLLVVAHSMIQAVEGQFQTIGYT